MGHNTRHHDRTSSLLLAAAADEFSEHGRRASMADVAERAGVSRATIYNYFATREDLIDALEIAAITEAERRLAASDLESISVADAVQRVSVALINCGAQFAVAIQPLQDRPLTAGEELIRPRLVQLFERGRSDGTFSMEYSVELLLALYYGLILGALLSTRTGGGTPNEVGTALARVFLNGVSARTRVAPVGSQDY